jgi:hypothetical protein
MEGISIREQFAPLEDARVERSKLHQVLDIITIALDCPDNSYALFPK